MLGDVGVPVATPPREIAVTCSGRDAVALEQPPQRGIQYRSSKPISDSHGPTTTGPPRPARAGEPELHPCPPARIGASKRTAAANARGEVKWWGRGTAARMA